MPANPVTRPSQTIRVLSQAEKEELFRMASEQGTHANAIISAQLGPLRKRLRRRIAARQQEHA